MISSTMSNGISASLNATSLGLQNSMKILIIGAGKSYTQGASDNSANY